MLYGRSDNGNAEHMITTFETLVNEHNMSVSKSYPRRVTVACSCGKAHDAVAVGMRVYYEPEEGEKLYDTPPCQRVYPVLIAGTEVVSRALHDDLARQIAEARRVLERYGLGYASLTEGIEALGIYAMKYGWDCEAEVKL